MALNSIFTHDKYSFKTFLIRGCLLYLGWIFLYECWAHPKGSLDKAIVDLTIKEVLIWLHAMSESTFRQQNMLGITGSHGLIIGAPCNAFSLIALFSGFIMAAPGRFLAKLIYISSGTMLIFQINVCRIVVLALLKKHAPQWLEFNHDYTFTLIMYTLIFFSWVTWMNRILPANSNKTST